MWSNGYMVRDLGSCSFRACCHIRQGGPRLLRVVVKVSIESGAALQYNGAKDHAEDGGWSAV